MNKKNILSAVGGVTLLGAAACGYMYYEYEQRWKAASSITPVHPAVPGAAYTLQEIAMHSTPTNCWVVIGDGVYDVTNFISAGLHNEEIKKGCGKDATALFSKVGEHGGERAKTMMSQLIIGTVQR